MTKDKILKQIKAIILPYIPEGKDEISFQVQAYPDMMGIEQIVSKQTEYIEMTTDETFSLHELILDLQKYQDFSHEPWTHFQATFYRSGHIDWQLANIPDEDCWPGLYMKGISELTWTEADAHRMPYTIWKKKSKLYISEHDRFYQELLSIFERNMVRVGWTVWFRGCIYQGQPQYEAFAIEADGTLHPQALELKKSQHLRLPKLLRQMQKSKLWPQPWTHFECRLGFMIPFEFKVADIPETDYRPGVYMRGIGE